LRLRRSARHLFRRHVRGGPQGGAALGERRRPGELGQPEVQDLHLASLRQEQVRRLDVPVDDPLRVGFRQPGRRLHHQTGGFLPNQRASPEPFPERFSLVAGHHDVERAVRRLADLVHRADVWVVQPGGGARLVEKALLGVDVPGQLRRQELEGHGALQGGVFRLVHHPHPALAELRQDPVMRNSLADHRHLAGDLIVSMRHVTAAPAEPASSK